MKDENRISRQQRLVMRHLENRGSITVLEAYDDYGIARLSSIIHRLRERDIPITTTLAGVTAAIEGLTDKAEFGRFEVCSLQEYHRHIRR